MARHLAKAKSSMKRFLQKIKCSCIKLKQNFRVEMLFKPFIGIVSLLGIVFIGYIILDHFGILARFNNIDSVIEILNTKYKILTVFIYIAIQMVQVLILPIPAIITTFAGTKVFGNFFEPVLYSLAGIIPASLIGFLLGRWLGKPFVAWMIGKDNMEKYLAKTSDKEKPLFFMMFLLPFFPDDILCPVAGVSKMSFKFFLVMQLICRPPAVIGSVLMSLISLDFLRTWYGIIIIIVLLAAFIAVVFCSFKYGTKIENFFITHFTKNKKKAPSIKELRLILAKSSPLQLSSKTSRTIRQRYKTWQRKKRVK